MTDYTASGVSISRGEEAVRKLKQHVEKTYTPDVLRGVGSFAGAISATTVKNMENPVLLASIDGVGTKTIIAEKAKQWEDIGKDIVNHSGNDLVCQGAKPLLFLDYVASGTLDPEIVATIVKGMCDACQELGCVLIGGETAEMPRVYHDGAHDVVGSIIGVVEREKMITGDTIVEGDILIALPSNGLHTNGYSLARKVLLEDAKIDLLAENAELGKPLANALLLPHTSYVKTVLDLHETVGLKGVAHITGGGIQGNLSRILPEGLGAEVQKNVIKRLPIFDLIQKIGKIEDSAMFEAFNMGVGMILVLTPEQKEDVLRKTNGGYEIGIVKKGSGVQLI